jgi:hypothetical protein
MNRAVGDREYDGGDADDDDRDSVLAPLVIDVIPEQTRAELEASIDAPLAVEREAVREDHERDEYQPHIVGTVGAGRTFDTRSEFRALIREHPESGTDGANGSGGEYHD